MQPWEQNWSGQPASSEAAPWERQWGGTPVAKPEEDGDFIRGGKEAFQQLPQMGYGLIAGAGAIGEKVFGEGGIATGVKQAGLKGYTEWADKMAAQSKPSDSWSYSYDKAKDGDFGALVDWLQHGIGYAGAQGVQMLATAGIGAAGGKLLIGTAADKLASGMVAKEAARLAAENATVEATKRIAADQISSLAVKNVASKLGQLGAVGALATGQEGGEIFGGLVQKAEEEGTQLSGGDLARAFGATLAAGGLEFVGDKLGLDVLLGRSKLVNPAKAMTGLGGRAARGVLAGAAVAPAEAATEYFQTGIEEYGKGTETNPLPWLQSPENQTQAFDAAALGGLGGAMVGGAGGAVHGAQTGKREEPVANIEDIATAPSIDEAIIAADKAVSGEPTRGERVANIKSELSDRAIVGDLRTKYGDDGFSQLLTSLNQANDPRTPEATREKHLQAVETALFNLRASVDQPAQTALLEGQQAMPMLTGPDGLPLLGDVSTPTGTMRAGPDGVAVPETAADLTETMRAADERASLGTQEGETPQSVIYAGMRREPEAGMAPRTNTAEPTVIDPVHAPNAVKAYVDKQRSINTPMAHAFVQAFDSGRITTSDVASLIAPRQTETVNDRLAAAAAQGKKITPLADRLAAIRKTTNEPTSIVVERSGARRSSEPERSGTAVPSLAQDTSGRNVASTTEPVQSGASVGPAGVAGANEALSEPFSKRQAEGRTVAPEAAPVQNTKNVYDTLSGVGDGRDQGGRGDAAAGAQNSEGSGMEPARIGVPSGTTGANAQIGSSLRDRLAAIAPEKADGKSRAVEGGQIGVNGYEYKGGQFLPSTELPPGSYRDKDGKVRKGTKSEQIEPNKRETAPSPTSRSVYGLVSGWLKIDGGKARLYEGAGGRGIRDHTGQQITPDTRIRPGVKGLLGDSDYSLRELIDLYNRGARWIELDGEQSQAGQPAAAPAPSGTDAAPVGVPTEPDAALTPQGPEAGSQATETDAETKPPARNATALLADLTARNEPVPSALRVQSRKESDGRYGLYFTGTNNEVWKGERFKSPKEARSTLEAVRAVGMPTAAPVIPRSFRRSQKVTTQVFDEASGKMQPAELDADTALRALNEDISALEAFLKCIG